MNDQRTAKSSVTYRLASASRDDSGDHSDKGDKGDKSEGLTHDRASEGVDVIDVLEYFVMAVLVSAWLFDLPRGWLLEWYIA